MRLYETIYILEPNASVDDARRITGLACDWITKSGGTISRVDDWGMKKLAYLIKKQSRGHYVYIEYAGDGPAVQELERNLRINDQVMKYLTVKIRDACDPASFEPFKLEDVEFHGPHGDGKDEDDRSDDRRSDKKPGDKAEAKSDEKADKKSGDKPDAKAESKAEGKSDAGDEKDEAKAGETAEAKSEAKAEEKPDAGDAEKKDG